MVAVGVLARAYAKVRDRPEEVAGELHKSNTAALIDLTRHVERQASLDAQVAEALKNLEEKLEYAIRQK